MKSKVRKDKRKQSLMFTLTNAFLMLSMIILSLVIAQDLYISFKAQQELVFSRQKLIGRNAVSIVKSFIEKNFEALNSAVVIGDLAISEQGKEKLVLEKLLGLNPSFRQLIQMDERGQVRYRVARVSDLFLDQLGPAQARNVFDQVKIHNNYFSPIHINAVTSEPMAFLAVPVKNVFGDFKGALIAEVNLKFLWDLVSQIKVGKKGHAYVVNKKGTLIASGDIARVLKGENLGHIREVNEFIIGEKHITEPHLEKGFYGNYVVSIHFHLEKPDWAVIVELPVMEAYAALVLKLKLSGAVILLIFSLTIFLGVYFAKKITSPIISLRNAAAEIGRGKLNTRIDFESRNEIGELAESFNQMVLDLKRTTVSKGELEQRVEERTAELMRQKQKAETAEKVKSEFLANMSHEIRTPMNAIVGFADLLQKTSLDKTQKNYVDVLQSSGSLLCSVINGILDFSKLESGDVILESIDFNLPYLVNDVMNISSTRINKGTIKTYVDIDQDLPQNFKGDPTKIRQVLLNLVSNALKFTSQGEIRIIVKKDKESSDKNTVMRFTVKDTGIGIPPENLGHIFDPFQQGDTSITRKFGGTGLGLSISKSIIDAMGGTIWADSEVGKGSEFNFSIALEEGLPIDQREIFPVPIEKLAGLKVLIVDDNQISREILTKLCVSLDMNVLSVENSGFATLEKLKNLAEQNNLPNLILSDIRMEGMSGFELVEKIRENKRYSDIKVITASSEAYTGQAQKAQSKGFDGYVSKPYNNSELVRVITAVFGDKRKDGSIVTRHMANELGCKGIKVLVAEDNLPNQMLMTEYAKELGYESDCVKNGQEAIEKLKEGKIYDVILMDFHMPVLGGVEATKIIRKEISPDIPIIALTAAVLEDDRKNATAAGMNDFLSKPINIDDLRDMIIKYGRKT